MIKLLIADDHPIVRSGIKAILSNEKNFCIVAEAEDGNDAFEKIKKYKPDVAIVDMSMPNVNGIELLVKVKKSKLDVNIVMLSNYDDEEYIVGSIKEGAKAYLLKDIELETLTETIKNVKNGEPFYSQRVSKILANQLNKKENKIKFTKTEMKVIKEIALGNSSLQIAENLKVGKRTIDTHRYRIMKKLNVHNSIELLKVVGDQQLLK